MDNTVYMQNMTSGIVSKPACRKNNTGTEIRNILVEQKPGTIHDKSVTCVNTPNALLKRQPQNKQLPLEGHETVKEQSYAGRLAGLPTPNEVNGRQLRRRAQQVVSDVTVKNHRIIDGHRQQLKRKLNTFKKEVAGDGTDAHGIRKQAAGIQGCTVQRACRQGRPMLTEGLSIQTNDRRFLPLKSGGQYSLDPYDQSFKDVAHTNLSECSFVVSPGAEEAGFTESRNSYGSSPHDMEFVQEVWTEKFCIIESEQWKSVFSPHQEDTRHMQLCQEVNNDMSTPSNNCTTVIDTQQNEYTRIPFNNFHENTAASNDCRPWNRRALHEVQQSDMAAKGVSDTKENMPNIYFPRPMFTSPILKASEYRQSLSKEE